VNAKLKGMLFIAPTVILGALVYFQSTQIFELRKDLNTLSIETDEQMESVLYDIDTGRLETENLERRLEQKLDDVEAGSVGRYDDILSEMDENSERYKPPPTDTRNFLERMRDESEAECQRKNVEYNTCLSEYSAEMAEYNDCVLKKEEYTYWPCFEPHNRCKKPICSY
jgi:hypothetical protein